MINFFFYFFFKTPYLLNLNIKHSLFNQISFFKKNKLVNLIFLDKNDKKLLRFIILKNSSKQLFINSWSIYKNTSLFTTVGIFLKMNSLLLKNLKKKEKIHFSFLKFFFTKTLILKNSQFVLLLKKYSLFFKSKLLYLLSFTFLNCAHIIFLAKKKFGVNKLKKVRAIKKNLKKKLLFLIK